MTLGQPGQENPESPQGGNGLESGQEKAEEREEEAEEEQRDHAMEVGEDHNPCPEAIIPALEEDRGDEEQDPCEDHHDPSLSRGQQSPMSTSTVRRSRADVSSLLQFVSVAGCDIRAALDKSAPCKRSVDHRKYLQKQLCRFSHNQKDPHNHHHHLQPQQQQQQPPSPNFPASCYYSCPSPPAGTGVSVVVAAPVPNEPQEEEEENEEEEDVEEEVPERLREDSPTGVAHDLQHYTSREDPVFQTSCRTDGDGGAEAATLTDRRTLSAPSAASGQQLQQPSRNHNKGQLPGIHQYPKQWSRDVDSLSLGYTKTCTVGEGSPSDLIPRETVSASEEEEEDQEEIKVEVEKDPSQEEKEVSLERSSLKLSPPVSSVSAYHPDHCMASSVVDNPTFLVPSLPSNSTFSSSSPSPHSSPCYSSPTSYTSSQTSTVISTTSTMVVASPIPETKAKDMEVPGRNSPLPTTDDSERDPLFEIPGVVNPEQPSTEGSTRDHNTPKKASIPLRQRQLPASFWREPKPELKRGLSSRFESRNKSLLQAHGSFLLPYSLGTQGPKSNASPMMEYKALVDLYGSNYACLISGSSCDVPRSGLTQTDYLLSAYGSKLPAVTDSAEHSSLSAAAATAAAYGTGGIYPWAYGILPAGEAEKVVASRLQGSSHPPHPHPPHPPPQPPPPPTHQPLHQVAGHSGVAMRNPSAAVHLHGHSLLYPHRQLGLGATGHLGSATLHAHHGTGAPEPSTVCSSWDPMTTLSQAQSLLRHPPAMAAASNLWRPIPTKTLTSYHSRFHPFPDVHRSMIDHALP